MRSKGKLLLVSLLSTALLAGVFGGCASGTSTESGAPSGDGGSTASQAADGAGGDGGEGAKLVNKTGFPIVNEPVTLKVTGMQTPVQKDLNEIEFFKRYEEKTGIHVEFTNIPTEFRNEQRNIILAAGDDLPDILFKLNYTGPEVSAYSTQGLFLPLNDLIDEYGPNVKATLEEWDDVRKGLTMPNGKIYSLSYVLAAPAITNGGNLFFNSEALEMVGKEVPTTLDELTDVLRALKGLDYNGNGQADEIPMSVSDPRVRHGGSDRFLLGSFGLGTRGSSHYYVDVDPATNEVRFMRTTENYKDLLMYMNSLYEEGLLDPDWFTMEMQHLIAKGEEGRVLSYVFTNHSIIGNTYGEKSVGLHQPLKGPDKYGDPHWAWPSSSLSGVGNFIITKDNKYPEASMRWVDYFYSDEGIREYFMGYEGETYEIDENGEYQYNDFVMNNPHGIMFEQVLGGIVPWAGGSNPSIANDKYFKGGEMQPISKSAADALNPYRYDTIWPAFLFEDDDADIINAIETDIETYVEENRAAFITGRRSFDEWDDYVAGFDSMRLDQYLEIYAKTAARYEG